MTNSEPESGDMRVKTLESKTEIYKLFVTTAEYNIDRRQRMNQFYSSVVAALFIAYAYLTEGKLSVGANHASTLHKNVNAILATPLWILPLFLLIVSMSWFSLLLSFRALSISKYTVIAELEKELPIRPFEREWLHYKRIRKLETIYFELAMPLLFYIASIFGILLPFVITGF